MIGKLLSKVPVPVRLRCRSAWWSFRRAAGLLETVPGGEEVSVVLLSYRRMRNLPYIVESLLLCRFVREIVLSNNNPDVRMEEYVRTRDPRLRIVNQPVRRLPGARYDLARGLHGRYFLAVDDDVFPTPRQIRTLFLSLLRDPSVPHGPAGEDYRPGADGSLLRSIVCGESRETDVIMWAYAFTREHLDRYFSLLGRMGLADGDIRSDDVVISFAGNGRPRCVGIGRLLCCPSSNDPAVATWRQDGFVEDRVRLYRQCREARTANRA